mmetsp:Transcript_130264/g.278358  ORF Transcript_130264/g.278358 Transcript_130264/m.278358 type:complete len:273 (-) Transcript_130264:95-913(-)
MKQESKEAEEAAVAQAREALRLEQEEAREAEESAARMREINSLMQQAASAAPLRKPQRWQPAEEHMAVSHVLVNQPPERKLDSLRTRAQDIVRSRLQGEQQRPAPPSGMPPDQAAFMPGAAPAPPKGFPAAGVRPPLFLGSSASATNLSGPPSRGDQASDRSKNIFRGHNEWEYEKIQFAPQVIKVENAGCKNVARAANKDGRKQAAPPPGRATQKLASVNGIYGRLGAKSLSKVQSLPTIATTRSPSTGRSAQREAQAVFHGSPQRLFDLR